MDLNRFFLVGEPNQGNRKESAHNPHYNTRPTQALSVLLNLPVCFKINLSDRIPTLGYHHCVCTKFDVQKHCSGRPKEHVLSWLLKYNHNLDIGSSKFRTTLSTERPFYIL
jgi:hypothetical protein